MDRWLYSLETWPGYLRLQLSITHGQGGLVSYWT